MSEQLYIFKCLDCYKNFHTDDPEDRVCPTCAKHRQPHLRRKKSKKNKPLTFAQISHIGNVYYKIHHKYLHYGDIVNLIQHTKAEHCVCCGEIIPEGKQVCYKCERAVK